ncbi:MAG: hypothetical protein V1899_00130, partial [Planctomycetota bacterium]
MTSHQPLSQRPFKMRIPFDLIAAILCITGIEQYLSERDVFTPPSLSLTLTVWGAFFLISWLLNELLTRRIEWRTRFGLHSEGLSGRHPLIIHTWGIRIVQTITVFFFVAALWLLDWPLWIRLWPEWLGLNPETSIGDLTLYNSEVMALFLNLFPFLIAMTLSWLPRLRLASSLRGKP